MEQTPLLARLITLFPEAKKTTLRDMVENKRVLLNGAVARSVKQPVAEGDTLEVLETAAARRPATLLAEGLKLVYFDGDLVVVNKPAELLTATDAQERRPTAWRILKEYFERQNSKNQVHLIHRLDKDASGLLVFARLPDAFSSLKKQFFEHTITRQYDVIVHGIPKEKKGRLENLLLENPVTGVVGVTKNTKTGKEAIMDYEVVDSSKAKKLSHVRCTLFTGRKHQIRVQMKVAGHVVCGDPLYGKADEPPGRLALHASHLAFAHPSGGRQVKFDSTMPGSFLHLLRGS